MKFVRWDQGVSEYSMTVAGTEELYIFIERDKSKAETYLYTHERELIAESVDLRPSWRRWLGLLGPVQFRNADGAVTCGLGRIGWSNDLRYTSGSVTERLSMSGGFMETCYESRSLQIVMQEHREIVAEFQFTRALDPSDVMLIVGHLVAYHCRL